MKEAKDLIPWRVTDISIRPYDGLWSFNPSIVFDGTLWLCVLRCCDYAMPSGITIRSPKAGPGHQSKNAMIIFDPNGWKPIRIYKMQERDGLPRASSANVGFEDMRLFRTDRSGLQGIAASLHLARSANASASPHQPPEQVVLSFDGEYNIVAAKPIRGDWWSGPQKNWVPFDHCAEPRFLYAIDRGTMFDDRGQVHGDAAIVRPSANARAVPSDIPIAPSALSALSAPNEQRQREESALQERENEKAPPKQQPKQDRRAFVRGADASMVRGRRVVADTLSTRPSTTRHGRTTRSDNGSRMLGMGRALPPRYAGLRGGTQLVRVAEDTWLGIGHEMKFVSGKKYYWHVWYMTDSHGKLRATSEPMKFIQNGIEFAAGMAIDGDRVVVSFGVDDMECKFGETSLSAVMGILKVYEG